MFKIGKNPSLKIQTAAKKQQFELSLIRNDCALERKTEWVPIAHGSIGHEPFA